MNLQRLLPSAGDQRALDSVVDSWQPTAARLPLPSAPRKSSAARCGFHHCAAPVERLWRRRNRPVFEGSWSCSRACLRGLVSAAVAREWAGSEGIHGATHLHRVPLGLVMLSQGWITHPQLRHALSMQQAAGHGRIGDWLVDECGISQARVLEGLGMQWNRPVLSAAGLQPARMALAVPRELRQAAGVAPLRLMADGRLYVGFAEHVDEAAALAVERMAEMPVETGLLSNAEFRVVNERLDDAAHVAASTHTVTDAVELTQRVCRSLSDAQPVASRLVRLGGAVWLRMWLEPASATPALPLTPDDVLDHVFTIAEPRLRRTAHVG